MGQSSTETAAANQVAPAVSPEDQRYAYEQNIRAAERAHDDVFEFGSKTNAAALENANLALRTLILVNGGAAISVLAFAGGLAAREKMPLGELTQIAGTLIWFAVGVAAATLSMGMAYFTNLCIAGDAFKQARTYQHPYLHPTPSSKRHRIAGVACRWFAIAGALLSLLLFIEGMIAVKDAVGLLQ